MMELGAGASVFPTPLVPRVMVVEPVAATKKGRKGSANLEPAGGLQRTSPVVLCSSPLPIVSSKVAMQPSRPRNSTRSTDAVGIRLASRFQSMCPSVTEKVASVCELTRVWIWAANLFFNMFVLAATWLPVVVMASLLCLSYLQPSRCSSSISRGCSSVYRGDPLECRSRAWPQPCAGTNHHLSSHSVICCSRPTPTPPTDHSSSAIPC